MSNPNPYEQLGVTEDASFDEIQSARNRLLQEHETDRQRVEAVEMAYDAVLMDRLRLRQEGRIKVPDRIRFAEQDDRPAPAAPQPTQPPQLPSWLAGSIDQPTRTDWLQSAGTFAVLMALGALNPGGDGSLLQLVLAIGAGASLFFLNRKERRFGRAVLLTVLGLIVGLIVGSAIASVVPPIPQLRTEQLTALVTLVVLWLTSCLLR